MLTLILILMANIILATWLAFLLLKLVDGPSARALNGAVQARRQSLKSCVSCTVPHQVLFSGSETLARLKLALLLGCLIAAFFLTFLLLLSRFTRLWEVEYLESDLKISSQ